MGALRDVLASLGGDHHLLGKLQDGVTIGQHKNVSKAVLESSYALAFNLYQGGQYDEARSIFRYLCFHDHTDSRFLAGFGSCCLQTGDIKQAVQILSQAAQVNPEDYMAQLHLAQALERDLQIEKCRQLLLALTARTKNNDKYKQVALLAGQMLGRIQPEEE